MELPNRKRVRMAGYDYSTPTKYFVTICSYHKELIFSKIAEGDGYNSSKVELTDIGKEVEVQITLLSARYKGLIIEHYVIMPNHIHMLIDVTQKENDKCSLSDIICGFKSLTSNECRKKYKAINIFQPSFHDHIIRNEKDYKNIYDYISSNPEKWTDDVYNEKHKIL